MFPCTAGVDLFPCYVVIYGIVSSQLDVVRKLIADVRENGSGQNYLIQHSAGSGKSNSIAWTAYRLASLHDNDNKAVFSSVVVVTDRVMLGALHDKLIADKKLESSARTSDPRIFVESIFPAAFGTAAMESFMESQESYSALFEDQSKYNAVMSALAGVIYREMRQTAEV